LGYIHGKELEMGKDEREKQKRWHQAWSSSSLSGGNSFPRSAKKQHALIFWPLHLLVLCVVAMLRPVRLCAVDGGRYGHQDLRRVEVRWYSGRYPYRYRGMDVVVVE
jgi:hypothetical protein